MENIYMLRKMQTTIKLIRLSKENHNIWQKLVDNSPHSSVYHNIDWIKIAQKHTNTELFLLQALNKNELIGGIPLFCRRKYQEQLIILMSPPYPNQTLISNLGPIFVDDQDIKEYKKEYRFKVFVSELEEYIKANIKPHITRIYMTPDLIDTRPFLWLGYTVTPEYTYITNLSDMESIWKNFKRSVRKSVFKLQKLGIVVHQGGFKEYKSILNSVFKRFNEQAIPLSVPYQYMIELFETMYPEKMRVFVARNGDRILSGQVITLHKNKIYFWIGGVRTNIKGVYPMDLLVWEIMKWGFENGFNLCENVGANNPSISTFKSRYGFILKPYFVVSKFSTRYKTINSALRLMHKATSLFNKRKVNKVLVEESELDI